MGRGPCEAWWSVEAQPSQYPSTSCGWSPPHLRWGGISYRSLGLSRSRSAIGMDRHVDRSRRRRSRKQARVADDHHRRRPRARSSAAAALRLARGDSENGALVAADLVRTAPLIHNCRSDRRRLRWSRHCGRSCRGSRRGGCRSRRPGSARRRSLRISAREAEHFGRGIVSGLGGRGHRTAVAARVDSSRPRSEPAAILISC